MKHPLKINRSTLRILLLPFVGTLLLAACQPANNEEKAEYRRTFHYPEWSKEDVIYEVNIRQYTPEGTFNSFEKHLPRLKEMGVDILWLMPIHPIGEKNRKGSLGSYYSVKDYLAVNPEFGTIEDFRSLLASAHELGMYVILDWVANHTAWDNVWVEEHPGWYVKDSSGNFVSPFDWTDVIKLDYNNEEMRRAMKDALLYWVGDENIDGYRCDVAGEVPTEFWNEASAELYALKPVFMLAEAELPEHHNQAFNMSYAWEMHHVMNEVAKGNEDVNKIQDVLEKNMARFPEGAYRMFFTSNHDENSWNGTVYERMGEAAETFAALTYILPGMPLIYSGQEAGLNKRLLFFEKDSISWDDMKLLDFYARLNEIKENNPALWNGNFGGSFERIPTDQDESIYLLRRQKVGSGITALFNLSDQDIEFNYDDENISFDDAKVLLSQGNLVVPENGTAEVSNWGFAILKNQ